MFKHELSYSCDVCGETVTVEAEDEQPIDNIPHNQIYENILIRDTSPGMADPHDICDECIGGSIPDDHTVVVGTSDVTGRAYDMTLERGDGPENFPRRDAEEPYTGVFRAVDKLNGYEAERENGKFMLLIDGEPVAQAEDGWTYPKDIPLDIADRIEYVQGWPDSDGS